MKKKIHIILHSKGGIGKSFISSILAQLLQSETNVDLDQGQSTFGSYKSLNVQHIDALTSDFTIDHARFDRAIEILLESKVAVVDTGANSFHPLMEYILANGIFEYLEEAGHEIIVHTIVAGGADLKETAEAFSAIANFSPRIVLWLNEHFGATDVNGKPFVESKLFLEAAPKVLGVIVLPRLNAQTTGADLNRLISARKTFAEADGMFRVMELHRLRRYYKDISEKFSLLPL